MAIKEREREINFKRDLIFPPLTFIIGQCCGIFFSFSFFLSSSKWIEFNLVNIPVK